MWVSTAYIRCADHLTYINATATQEVLPTSPTPHNDVAASDNLHAIPPEEAFESPNDSISEVRRLPAKEAAAKDDSDEVVEPHGLLPYNGRSDGSFHSFAEVGLDGTNDLEAGEGREGNRKRRDCLKQAMERLFWFLIWLVCWPIHTAVTRSML